MTRIQLKKGLRLLLQGREYTIEQRLPTGVLQLRNLLTNTITNFKEVVLTQLLFQGELQFLGSDSETVKQQNDKGYSSVDFTELPPELKEEAKRRYRYVSRVLNTTPNKRTAKTLEPIISLVSKEIEDDKPPSWLTLYRWLKKYSSSGEDIRSLVPLHSAKGNRQPRLNPEVRQIIKNAIDQVYLNTTQAEGADVYDRVIIEINQSNRLREALGQEKLAIPSMTTIYRAIAQLDSHETAIARYGRRIASSMYDPVKLGPSPSRSLERVEIDHTKLPLFVVDTETRLPIGTPWLTSAIDKYSGVNLGYYASFEPPSYLSVMQCMSHAIRPKNYLRSSYPNVENDWDTYGLPEVIVVDNGKEFYSTSFEDACLSLGIVIQYSPPKMPWYKSAIERYFGALNTQLLSHQPGKTFAKFMQQYDYDPKRNAVVSFEALQEILHLFVVDIYNQSSHPQLKSPRQQVWNRAIASFPPALPPSITELKVLIGATVERTITRRGIEFEGLIYNSSQLARLRSEMKQSHRTKVKYDPTDLSSVYVLDSCNYQFIEVPALHQEYTQGLTLWQHKVVKQLARLEADEVDIVALALAKEKIQRIVEQEWKQSKRGKTRQSMARWLGIESSSLTLEIGEKLPPSESQTIDSSVEVAEGQPSSYSGISNLDNALVASPIPTEATDIHQTRFPENDSLIQSKTDEVKADSNSIEQNQNTSDEIQSTQPVRQEPIEDDWQPDLSGWDVSYGLPK